MASARDPESLERLTRAHLEAAARAWDTAGAVSNFKSKTPRKVIVEGRRFPTKAIVALAHQLAGLGTLTSKQLADAARRRLEALGFRISGHADDDLDRGQGSGTPAAVTIIPAQLDRADVVDAIRQLDVAGDARRISDDLHETAWRIRANGRWYSMLGVLQIAFRRHGVVTLGQLKALLKPKPLQERGQWRRRLSELGFPPDRGLAARDPTGSGAWPPPLELTRSGVISAADAWNSQTDAFRTKHAAQAWEVWIEGRAYPVKAICILAYLALGYDAQRMAVWKKSGRSSPWDRQIEDLGFEIRAKRDPEELDLERFLEREDVPTEIRREGISRLTQGSFRRDLIAARRGTEQCDVTGIAIPEVLRASHIHRWADCKDTPTMRRDPANGLLLAAHLDALFEHGLIAFAADGKMLVSHKLDLEERRRLQIAEPQRLCFTPSPRQCEYLARHRERTRAARKGDEA